MHFRLIVLAATVLLGSVPQPARAQMQMYQRPVPAPSLAGAGQWLNVSSPLNLPDLRGKFVLLDFWTYCCINCMHILPELKKLEAKYPNELVVIGVHSAKFATERDLENIRQAILRYEVQHPVLNDVNLTLWRRYGINVWPSLRLIDPEGNLIAHHSGEITFDQLDGLLKGQIPKYRRARSLDERPVRFDLELYRSAEMPLRFPGKILVDEANQRIFVADSGHNRIVVAGLDGQLQSVIGTGEPGVRDGGFDEAAFKHPQGMALDGDDLYVADTENHLIRRVDLQSERVVTVAGNGTQARVIPKRARTAPRIQPLASPWDLWIHDNTLYIAMAGTHQIWRLSLQNSVLGPFAGNAIEDIVDGPSLAPSPFQMGYASFAQPSGLASDGQFLFVADSEGSSIRAVPLERGNVTTIVGTAGQPEARLFTFGDRDGLARQALLQHPIGLAYDASTKAIFVADTYNNKIKRIELQQPITVTTVPTGQDLALDEPGDVEIADGVMYIADTNNHRIVRLPLSGTSPGREFEIIGLRPTSPPVVNPFGPVPDADSLTWTKTGIRPKNGEFTVQVTISLPPGHKINAAAPMSYAVHCTTPGVLDDALAGQPIRIESPASTVEFQLPLRTDKAAAAIRIHLVYYYCREGAEGLCMIGNTVWTGEIEIDTKAAASLLKLEHSVRPPPNADR